MLLSDWIPFFGQKAIFWITVMGYGSNFLNLLAPEFYI
jgi:hypothetical protein